ncbi:MAG: membrane protein insertion efficiency factor YidD [bacterium]
MKHLLQLSALSILMFCSTIQVSFTSSFETGEMRQPCCTAGRQPSSFQLGYNASDTYLDVVCKGTMTFYSTVLRPVISTGCYCHPSCSEYMALAIQTHGFPIGLILGLERLLHEYGEYQYGKVVLTPEGWRIYDPVDSNTSWWRLP